MRRAAVIVLIPALALALALAGCGSNKRTIPTAKAESMLNQLDKIGEQFDSQACVGAAAKVQSLLAQARALPSSVDSTVRRNLVAGIARLQVLVTNQCQRPTPTTTTTTPTVTTPTTTAPTTTTPTTTTPPTTPTTTTPNTNTTPTTPGGGGGVTVPGEGTTGP